MTFKEVRLSPKIGTGDFDTKVHRAVEFLSEGDRIKVTVRFRGRELSHPELGRNLLVRFTEAVKDHGVIERPPLLEGKSMFTTFASTHKPKIEQAPAAQPAQPGSAQTPSPAPAPVQVPTPSPATQAPPAEPAATGG